MHTFYVYCRLACMHQYTTTHTRPTFHPSATSNPIHRTLRLLSAVTPISSASSALLMPLQHRLYRTCHSHTLPQPMLYGKNIEEGSTAGFQCKPTHCRSPRTYRHGACRENRVRLIRAPR